jgi:hypothetical protein
MKLYLVQPAIPSGADEREVSARLASCIEPIADLILPYLLADPAMFGMRHANEGSHPLFPMTDRYGSAEVVRLDDEARLRAALIACGDPNSGQWMLLRSLVTCRSVFYGYDGQAFVCLPSEDDPITSPNNAVIDVSDRSQMLIDTDWMDGLRSD